MDALNKGYVIVATDASALSSPGRGGWSSLAISCSADGEIKVEIRGGSAGLITSHAMGLEATIQSARSLSAAKRKEVIQETAGQAVLHGTFFGLLAWK